MHPNDHVTDDLSGRPPSSDRKMIVYSIVAATAGITIFATYGMRYWRKSMERHVQEVKEQVGQLIMTRRRRGRAITTRSTFASQLDLSPNYRQYLQENFPQHKVMSLGEYLDSLQPVAANILPKEELDTLLAAALLRVLGPSLGRALLPALKFTPLYTKLVEKLTPAASSNTQPQGAHNKEGQPMVGKAARSAPSRLVGMMSGISLTSLLGIADITISLTNKGRQSEPSCTSNVESPRSSTEGDTASSNDSNLQKILKHGEIESPTIHDFPNPFIFSRHWNKAVDELEIKLKEASGGEYNPEEYPKVEPSPVHEILLPDLYMGAGDAIKTHTNRQIVQNRLLSILFNRLAANYLRKEVSDLTEFTVQLDAHSEALTDPPALTQALIQSGHSVAARSSCRVTTFGFTLSVKEQDEKDSSIVEWFHIPLALPLRSGIEASDGTHVPAYLMHSCIGFTISAGPLIKDNLSVEFYHNQDGFCGWTSSHYTDLPWVNESVSHSLDAVRATRFSGWLATCINSVALRINLPNGGYGSIGVCNDSAAVVDWAVRGKTHVYPITYIGSFFYHIVKRAQELVEDLKKQKKVQQKVREEAELLHKTMMNLPNDVHPTPSTFPETTRRILESMPKNRQFIEMDVAVQMLKEEFVAT